MMRSQVTSAKDNSASPLHTELELSLLSRKDSSVTEASDRKEKEKQFGTLQSITHTPKRLDQEITRIHRTHHGKPIFLFFAPEARNDHNIGVIPLSRSGRECAHHSPWCALFACGLDRGG